ncbi:hypothetical protein BGZ65_010765 [Modicella reniformis]|uniref:NADH dehydrogenase [ubiquinone] 1 alpha subcomplex subunit n=1 Tax=Modicella reniformis TaxID=1440133 RepID=A0A9P6M1Y9_9FUNG|nr:hypothetical protein BGZ65_010765 [Modicella reniformis]
MSTLSWTRKLTLSLKAIVPGGGRRLAGKDRDGNLFFEKPDPNGGRYPRRTVELADPQLSEANYDDANITVQWQAWLRNTRRNPPTPDEIQRDEARKQLTVARAKILDQAWQDRKAELVLEQDQSHKTILSIASKNLAGANNAGALGSYSKASSSASMNPFPFTTPEDGEPKSAARRQVEEREAARKAGFKPQVQQGDTYQPQTWSPTAARRR